MCLSGEGLPVGFSYALDVLQNKSAHNEQQMILINLLFAPEYAIVFVPYV